MLDDTALVRALQAKFGNRYQDLRAELPDNPNSPSGQFDRVESLEQVEHWAIHHSLTTPNTGARAIWNWHIKNNGWAGIGYHFVVTAAGMVQYVGHVGTDRANVAKLNHKVRGICLVGDYTDSVPSAAQLDAVRDLCAILDDVYGVRPRTAHKSLAATACPGNRWEEWRERLERSAEEPATDPDLRLEVDRLKDLVRQVDGVLQAMDQLIQQMDKLVQEV